MKDYINVIGSGLAGSEAAYQIASRGIKVRLYEMKPKNFSPAHSNKNFAEIVCSNSFKSNLLTNACGLLKQELRILNSLLIKIADETAVPAGQALAVDREEFSKRVTEEINKNPLIEIITKEVGKDENLEEIIKDSITIIATGPLTSDSMINQMSKLIGNEKLYFYDAAAPILTKDSINFDIAFYGNRYEQEKKKEESAEEWKKRLLNQEKSYINLPMNQQQYEKFFNELIKGEIVELHKFEKKEIFEGCMPIEVMASRGIDTLRYGPLKPVGFDDPKTEKRPYALVQLRQDDKCANLYNIVGFQTNLKFGEQKRIFKMIPGLENAEFVKYGVMHRNTYINSTKLLEETYNLKTNKNIFFAGQITGVEGYVESISSGLVSALNAVAMLKGKEKVVFPETTVIGSLAKYISTENNRFQPMNANFGILPELSKKIKDKKEKNENLAEISLKNIEICKKNINML